MAIDRLDNPAVPAALSGGAICTIGRRIPEGLETGQEGSGKTPDYQTFSPLLPDGRKGRATQRAADFCIFAGFSL